jgi:hypothetical protein
MRESWIHTFNMKEKRRMQSSYPYFSRTQVQEAFHDPVLLESIWHDRWGVDNGVGKIRRVLMHRPGPEVLKLHEHGEHIESDPLLLKQIKGKQKQSSKSIKPDLPKLQSQHEALVSALRKEDIHVELMDHPIELWPERMFTRDN